MSEALRHLALLSCPVSASSDAKVNFQGLIRLKDVLRKINP
jgi:hypothetical protein